MKKLFSLLAITGLLLFGASNLSAQEEDQQPSDAQIEEVSQAASPANEAATNIETQQQPEDVPIHKAIKTKFIEGGAGFMASVLLALILGLALSIERILYLGFSTTNTKKLLENIEDTLNSNGVDAAKELCRNTRGPVASIFYQGLDRYDQGLDAVEKSIVSYGSVQMGLMERGITWINLFIALAPMLGFLGTVIGMIQAFNSIEQAGDISASLVAAGIKVALITTVAGLIVAMILQIFCNYILSKVEALTSDMEDASISFIDILIKYQEKIK